MIKTEQVSVYLRLRSSEEEASKQWINEIVSETKESSAKPRERMGVSRRGTSEQVVKEDLTRGLNDNQVAMGRSEGKHSQAERPTSAKGFR